MCVKLCGTGKRSMTVLQYTNVLNPISIVLFQLPSSLPWKNTRQKQCKAKNFESWLKKGSSPCFEEGLEAER